MKNKLKNLLPWVIAAALLVFIFRKTPPALVLSAWESSRSVFFSISAIGYFIFVMTVDCGALSWLLTRFVTPVKFGETLLMRGATYLLMVINYNLGQGGIAFYLKRTHGAPLFKTLGVMSFVTLIDLSLMVLMALSAVIIEPVVYRDLPLRPVIFNIAGLYFLAVALWFFFWKHTSHPLLIKLTEKWRLFHWLIGREVFHVFKDLKVKDVATAFFWRLPLVMFITCAPALLFLSFYATVPLTKIFIYTPIMLLVGTLPITPSGLGTSQLLFEEFYKNTLTSPLLETGVFTAGQLLISASLLWQVGNLILKIIMGAVCLMIKSPKLFAEEETAAVETT